MVLTAAGLGRAPAVFVPLFVVLIGLEVAFFTWYRRYRGTSPTLRNAPPEIAREMRLYFVGVAVVLVAVVVSALVLSAIVAAAAAFVLVTAGLLVYERRYEAAVREIRARLS
jgi:hypothetical protein